MEEEKVTLKFIEDKLIQLLDESIVTNARIDYIEAGQQLILAEMRALRKQIIRLDEKTGR